MENAKPNISPRRGMTPLERAWAAALCASGDAVANMGTDALRLMATKKAAGRNQRRHYGEHSQAGARLPDH